MEQDEIFQLAGGSATAIGVVDGVALGVVLIVTFCYLCRIKVYAPSLDTPAPTVAVFYLNIMAAEAAAK